MRNERSLTERQKYSERLLRTFSFVAVKWNRLEVFLRGGDVVGAVSLFVGIADSTGILPFAFLA
jgi:hypothetical protein